jgi:hypothetical protein
MQEKYFVIREFIFTKILGKEEWKAVPLYSYE